MASTSDSVIYRDVSSFPQVLPREREIPTSDGERSARPLSTQSKCAIVAFVIGSIAGIVIIGLAAINLFGPVGSTGFIGSLAGGGALTLISGGGIIWIAISNCRNPHTQSTGHLRSRSRGEAGNETSSVTTDVEDSRLDNIVSIGSNESRLDEDGIRAELGRLRGRIDILVIYGNGNVKFNTDPGFVDMNPKKVILVGARIIHAPVSGARLDDTLNGKEEWLKGRRACTPGRVNDATLVCQLTMSSIEEAIDHQPDRYSSTERYHVVYLIEEGVAPE